MLYCEEYLDDVRYIADFEAIDWSVLRGRTILLSGATGQIGSMLVDALLCKNDHDALSCKIIALTRNEEKASRRFSYWGDRSELSWICADISKPMDLPAGIRADYVLHLASNTHPLAYAGRPVETILLNTNGTDNLLRCALNCGAKRFLLASSNEIYGENRGDTELFDENYCGFLDCNTLRAGYPESKRCSEALVQAYREQYGQDAVIARFTRTYGPTLLEDDSKALSQFIRKGLGHEDVILKSEGTQMYSYTYVADAVTGLLCILTEGKDGEAYNIAEPSFDIPLYEVAACVARLAGTKLQRGEAAREESRGFSKVVTCRIENRKLLSLGWRAAYPLERGLARTFKILGQE